MEERQYAAQRLLQMQNLFGEPGWKFVIEEANAEINYLKDMLVTATSWEDVRFVQGRIDQLVQLVYLEDNTEALLASFDNDNPYGDDENE
jgi:hypothetical protein